MTLESQLKEVEKRTLELKKAEAQLEKPIPKRQKRILKRLAKIKPGTFGAPKRTRIIRAKEFLRQRREFPPKIRKERERLRGLKGEIKEAIQRRDIQSQAISVVKIILGGGKFRLGSLSPEVRKETQKLLKRKDIKKALIRVQKAQKFAIEKRGLKSVKEFAEYLEVARGFSGLARTERKPLKTKATKLPAKKISIYDVGKIPSDKFMRRVLRL